MGRYSPLHNFHLQAGAKMADFGGWDMPIEYPSTSGGGVLSEHQAVRQAVGLFDVSHLGKAAVTGDGALDFLNGVFTNDLNRIADGQAQYTLLCDPQSGGVIDDLIVYRHSASKVFLIPNAANTDEVVRRLQSNAPANLEIENQHEKFSVLALQGPKSLATLQALGISTELSYMSFSSEQINGLPITLCRTGYTGELGFEILTRWQDTHSVWDELVTAIAKFDGKVCGLGARDTLRTEMGYPLHGHELTLEISPVEASASWAVAWEKEFLGKEVLLHQKQSKSHRVLQAIQITDRGIPRAGMNVLDEKHQVIGLVTSGTFSPTLKTGIALALLDTKLPIDTQVLIDVRGRQSSGVIKKLPFVESKVK